MADVTIDQKRIYELAKDYKISSPAMMKILQELGFVPKSHMSVASPEMISAMGNKFAQERQTAKREMEQKTQAKEAREKAAARPVVTPPAHQAVRSPHVVAATPVTPSATVVPPVPGAAVAIGGIKVSNGSTPVAGLMRKIEKKKKKKERRRKKDQRVVNQAEVQKAFKSTMANLGGSRSKKRYHRGPDDRSEAETGDSNVVEVNEYMSVAELANLLDHKPAEVIAKLFEMGMMATINQRLDMDTIGMVASEFGIEVRQRAEIGEEFREEEHSEMATKRAPVVTVMGHVDHGKTSLLDYIRKTNVVASEAGAITQHIGAYEVMHKDDRIVFLDTPGHEAFTAMRARGAHLTDIVVLVVAADEAVMPQTIEAIDHARAANSPIIVAINKIDKPGANPENVRTQLSNHGLLPEEWGGKTITAEVSAKQGIGIEKLLDMILLQAEMMDLKADASIRAQGVVVDSRLERGRGPVATVLIQKGTCKVGDPIVAGTFYGRIRTLLNDHDKRLDIVMPSTPAQITGLNGVPQAGDTFMAVKDDAEAKEIATKRSQVKREYESRRPMGHVTLERVFDQIKEGQIKEVRLIIKGDVDGSVEVLSDTLGKISTSEVKTNIIRRGVGAITESDVLLAAASNAIIIGFQVQPDSRAREVVRREKVDVRTYDVIYEAEDDVRKALEGLLSPTISEQFVGQAEVRDLFRVPKVGVIAGCYVKEGRINRKDKVRLVRDGKVIYTGVIGSLRRFKDDAREVKEGFECGIGIENFNDVKVGDMIESFELIETARTLQA